VRDVVVGSGALDAMPDGAVLDQMSTIGIAATEAIAHECAARGVPFVDAPVLGTREPAEQGKLIVLASGPDDALERCAPVFDAVGARTLRLGEAGNGTRLKLVVNHWLLALVGALAESIKLAEAIDVDPRRFLEAISGGPVGPAYADVKGAAMIERRFTPPSFPLRLAAKDADLVLEAAERHDHALGLLPVVREQLRRALEAGHGDEDLAALFEGV
jgi:3-hydroxyisobutyrate dehydrogenase